MAGENEFLLHALFMGIFITFIYDLLRIFRKVVPHRGFFVSAEDLLFWIYCGEEVFLLMYHESDGTLRWFAVLGALTGMFLYRKLISPYFVKYVSMALNRILKLVGRVLRFLSKPLKILFRRTGTAMGRAGRKAGRWLRQLRRILKNKLTCFLKKLKMTIKA
ncbi:MAG: spore cortex biosynthesis protein YabQ [Acetatifactor sp.]|nr:spore cortex biosynthesis protein YabQ [Acetatifactor sp.]